MENLTHSLTGMALAEAAIQTRAWRKGVPARSLSLSWRSAAFLTSVFANNVPDLDLLMSPLTDGKLGYLLHHRGYTHTLVMVGPQAAIVMLLPLALSRWRLALWTRADWRWLFGLALTGTVVHMLLDYGNSYGVHLFWPFDDRWSFGDSVFIIEPAFWLALAPMLFAAVRTGAVKTLMLGVFIAALGIELLTGLVPVPIGVAFAVMGLGLFALGWRLTAGWRLAAAGSAYMAVMALFYGAGGVARRVTEAALTAAFPGWRTEDAVLSPLASDPVCHTLIALQVDATGRYAMRRAVVSIAPSLVPAGDCPELPFGGAGTMPLVAERPAVTDAATVLWKGTAEMPLAKLKSVYSESCQARAFFRFARVPFVVESGGRVTLGDLRFDRGGGPGFAEIALAPSGTPCPERVPSWEPPRAALLAPGAGLSDPTSAPP